MNDLHVSWIDSLIVIVYVVATLMVGLVAVRYFRKGKTSEDEYYLGGRRVPAWVNGMSSAVTAINSDVAPAYCGMAAVVGLSVSWFYLSRFGMTMMIGALLFAARWRALGITTGPQFASIRFGGRSASMVRIVNSFLSVTIAMVPWIGAGILGAHMIFRPLFGFQSEWLTIALVVIPVLIYVWVAGYLGVVFTDVLQTAVIILASLFMIGAVLWHFGGPSGLAGAISAADPARAGQILSATPAGDHRVLTPLLVFLWLLVPAIGSNGGVALDGQRLFSCKNSKEAAKSMIWGYGCLTLVLLALTLPAMGVIALRPEIFDAAPGEREQAYGIMLGSFLPTGALGLTLAAVLASVMSTLSGHLNYASQTIINDIYRPLGGDPGPRLSLWLGRAFTLVIVGLSIVVVFNSRSLIGIAITVAGLAGAAASFGWGQWWWWRANVWGWVTATFGGPVIYVIIGVVLGRWTWWQERWALPSPDTAGMLHAAAGIAVTTVAWIVVSLLTPPTKREQLVEFYRRARPSGLWGPVRAEVARIEGPGAVPPRYGILCGLMIGLIGVAMVTSMIVALSELFIGRYTAASGAGCAGIITGFVFKKAFNWHIDRLDPERMQRHGSFACTNEKHSAGLDALKIPPQPAASESGSP
ncbi:Na+/proline symporter [Opitutaceae bacterium TAV1]|nr:Na+/proline symporter [Opitutaceae bacterium TAV1]